MAFTHGSKAVFKLADATDVLTDISQYLTSVDFPQDVDTADVTTFGSTYRKYLAGLTDATISIEGIFDPAVDQILNAARSKAKDFEYYPQGSTAGLPKYSGQIICTNYTITSGVDGAVTFTADFQAASEIVRGTA